MGTTEIDPAIEMIDAGPPPRAWGQRGPSGIMKAWDTAHPHEHGDNELGPDAIFSTVRPTPTSMGTTRINISGFQRGRRPTPTSMGTTFAALEDEDVINRPTPTSMGTTISSWELAIDEIPAHPHEHGDNDMREFIHDRVQRPTPTSMGTTSSS